MGKCSIPKKESKKGASTGGKVLKKSLKGASTGGKVLSAKKPKRKGHPANMFILYYLDMYRQHGGNMYCVAKVCGQKWKTLPQSVKDKYRRQYCAKLKTSRVCRGASAGSKKK